METIEKNKLIAEVMGLQTIIGVKTISVIKHDQLKLFNPDSDWNWLMEVVEKIESLGFKSCIENWFCSFDGNSEETESLYFENKNAPANKIDAVYDACIEFIKLYNKQKK